MKNVCKVFVEWHERKRSPSWSKRKGKYIKDIPWKCDKLLWTNLYQKTIFLSWSSYFSYPEDTGDTSLRNIDKFLLDYMASCPKRQYSSFIKLLSIFTAQILNKIPTGSR
jgi:hypothetical protein